MPNVTQNIIAVLLYAFIGVVFFGLSFWVADKVTPGHMWKELIENKNVALGVFLAGVAIGLSVIIAAAVH